MPSKHDAVKLAENLVAKYSSIPPVDVEKIARSEGLVVFYQELQSDVSGLLVRQLGQTFCFVNSRDHKRRQRFTVGHELGHFILGHQENSEDPVHVDKGNFAIFRDSNSKTGQIPNEIAANQFSAALLMPSKLIASAIKKHGHGPYSDADVTAMAEEFNVSEQAMALRLAKLEYL